MFLKLLIEQNLGEIYEKYKNEDGYLYITFTFIPGLGWKGKGGNIILWINCKKI